MILPDFWLPSTVGSCEIPFPIWTWHFDEKKSFQPRLDIPGRAPCEEGKLWGVFFSQCLLVDRRVHENLPGGHLWISKRVQYCMCIYIYMQVFKSFHPILLYTFFWKDWAKLSQLPLASTVIPACPHPHHAPLGMRPCYKASWRRRTAEVAAVKLKLHKKVRNKSRKRSTSIGKAHQDDSI